MGRGFFSCFGQPLPARTTTKGTGTFVVVLTGAPVELQQFAVAGDVAALGQLGERDIGGNDADEQREKARW